jgi:hypothetical protein
MWDLNLQFVAVPFSFSRENGRRTTSRKLPLKGFHLEHGFEKPLPRLMTEQALSCLIEVSCSSLQKMRVRGDGPPYIKVGRLVRYDPDSARAWLASRVTTSTSQKAA